MQALQCNRWTWEDSLDWTSNWKSTKTNSRPICTSNREITTWYYVNSWRNIDSEKIWVPDGIWTHYPLWSSWMSSTTELLETLWWASVKLWVLTETASRGYTVNTHNLTLAHHRVSSSSVAEHPTRSWRIVGSNPIWDSDIFQVYVSSRIYVICTSWI